MNRVLFAAPKSGSGKTLITCGIMQAFINQGKKVSAFKCGPDYIDPMFHSKIVGVKSGNLDTFFCDENTVKYLLNEGSQQSDIAVVEGVMGYYDGLGGISIEASAYDVARVTKTPVVLIVDCKGLSVSVVAQIKGFVQYKEESYIRGVILNRISPMLYSDMKRIIEDEVGIKVLGYVPELKEVTLESRHLGLLMPHEIDELKEKMILLAQILDKTIHLDEVMEISSYAGNLKFAPVDIPVEKKVRIGVAMDEAFCFYYRENLNLIEKMGGQLLYFSPLKDEKLPDDLNGLILGGGYPELLAKDLSANETMRKSIKNAMDRKMPCIAECGGFLYLQNSLQDANGDYYPMAGVLNGLGFGTEKLTRFGYINIKTNVETVFGPVDTDLKGHEFHYWDSSENGNACTASKPNRNRKWQCVQVTENVFAGFPHLYFYSNVTAISNFMKKCGEYNEI